jgi:hypothetical protein
MDMFLSSIAEHIVLERGEISQSISAILRSLAFLLLKLEKMAEPLSNI